MNTKREVWEAAKRHPELPSIIHAVAEAFGLEAVAVKDGDQWIWWRNENECDTDRRR